jgi:hypothetical protein
MKEIRSYHECYNYFCDNNNPGVYFCSCKICDHRQSPAYVNECDKNKLFKQHEKMLNLFNDRDTLKSFFSNLLDDSDPDNNFNKFKSMFSMFDETREIASYENNPHFKFSKQLKKGIYDEDIKQDTQKYIPLYDVVGIKGVKAYNKMIIDIDGKLWRIFNKNGTGCPVRWKNDYVEKKYENIIVIDVDSSTSDSEKEQVLLIGTILK